MANLDTLVRVPDCRGRCRRRLLRDGGRSRLARCPSTGATSPCSLPRGLRRPCARRRRCDRRGARGWREARGPSRAWPVAIQGQHASRGTHTTCRPGCSRTTTPRSRPPAWRACSPPGPRPWARPHGRVRVRLVPPSPPPSSHQTTPGDTERVPGGSSAAPLRPVAAARGHALPGVGHGRLHSTASLALWRRGR